MSIRSLMLLCSAVAFVFACDESLPMKNQPPGAQGSAPIPAAPPPAGGQPQMAPTAAAPGGGQGKPWSVVVQGSIDVDSTLVGKVPNRAVVFITGRAAEGGPALLVKKIPAARFPLAFTLTNRDLMNPGLPIPETIGVHVRLDQDGDAISRTPGDLMGQVNAVHGATDAKVILSEVVEQFKPGQRIE